MIVSDLLNDVTGWAFRLLQQYKSKQELLMANNQLLKVLLEMERVRSEEQIKARELEQDLHAQRERLGRDLHDCFGSQLTHVISRLDLLAGSDEPDCQQLSRLNDFVREMNQTLRETIWVLDQESVTANAFGERVQGMLLKIWEDRDSPVLHWQFQAFSERLLIQPFAALQIIRIIQEATNNSVKYAAAKQVVVSMKIQKQMMELAIEDNGSGFNMAKHPCGYGISNMRKRVEGVRGTFRLQSNSSGTNIQIKIPLAQ